MTNAIPLRCRIFGHRWEQTTISHVWYFKCARCTSTEPVHQHAWEYDARTCYYMCACGANGGRFQEANS